MLVEGDFIFRLKPFLVDSSYFSYVAIREPIVAQERVLELYNEFQNVNAEKKGR